MFGSAQTMETRADALDETADSGMHATETFTARQYLLGTEG